MNKTAFLVSALLLTAPARSAVIPPGDEIHRIVSGAEAAAGFGPVKPGAVRPGFSREPVSLLPAFILNDPARRPVRAPEFRRSDAGFPKTAKDNGPSTVEVRGFSSRCPAEDVPLAPL